MRESFRQDPILLKMIRGLVDDLGDRLDSVVLYGSAARGDFLEATSDYNLIVVLSDLDPATLEAIGPAMARWRKRRQPSPRIFSPAVIAESADVFPIEFLDIKSRRVVLHGRDPFETITINREHLRLQCEREMREKMMRLREGFVEAHAKPGALRLLIKESFSSFVALFRGCLHLLGGEVPVRNDEVVAAFCARADLDRAPFEEVDRLRRGQKGTLDPNALFMSYYGELTKAVHRVDRFVPPAEEVSQ